MTIGPLLLAATAGAADFLGAIAALAPLRVSRKALLYLFGMSGGYLLTWSVAHLIPMLVLHDPGLVTWTLIGYFGLYVLENLFASHAHLVPTDELHGHALVDRWGHDALITPAACWAAVVGLLIHAFFDGVGIVASFAIHPTVGAMMFLAVILHKVPEGSSLTSILGAAQQRTSVIVATAAGTALATVLGGVVVWMVKITEPEAAYPLVALSAGTFLFIGASNLIPATQKGESRHTVLAVLSGAVLFYGVSMLLHAAGVHHE